MSLHPHEPDPVPAETARIAHAAFPAGNLYLRLRDQWGVLFADQQFAHLFSQRGQPAEAPWRLALVTLFQFAENHSDRQAADAVRARLDWKYALSLNLTDSGFDHTVLSEFRSRLLAAEAEQLLFDTLLDQCRQHGLLKTRGRQRTDSTHVLAAVRALNRVELVRETLRHALNTLAALHPDWLSSHAQAAWVERYGRQSDEYHLPKGKPGQQVLADQIGQDGTAFLRAVYASDAPVWLREVPAVDVLRRVWVQNYWQDEDQIRFRTEAEGIPKAAHFLSSPHDTDAHLSKKHTTCWVGYKVHLTETCEDEAPNLITHVETTPAPTADGEVTPRVHRALAAKGLLPTTHLVDTGFLDAALLVESQRDYAVNLMGPTRRDQRWQARAAEGFGSEHFAVDFAKHVVTCPAGRTSIQWDARVDNRGNDSIYVRFSPKDCGVCSSRTQCTKSQAKHPRRSLAIRPQAQYEALRHRRAEEASAVYAHEYSRRAGIEGTISQGVRRAGMRRSRYIGLAKTHLGHVLTAAALNFVRVADWLAAVPRARTRQSPFAMLMAHPT